MSGSSSAGLFASVQDPTDLDHIRAVLAASQDASRLVPLGIRRLVITADAATRVADHLADLVPPGADVRLLVDPTAIRRGGSDLKADVEAALRARFSVTRVVLGHDAHLLADDEALDAATAAVTGGEAVVTVGGGTITDIGKVATARRGGLPLVVVQTAASVDGYTDNVSVVLKQGVKRTIPSRWPDVVLADTTVIGGAPLIMNSAGLGEVLSLYTAPADWELAARLGLDDSFAETPRDLLLAFAGDPAEWAQGLADGDPAAVERLTRVLAIRGIGTGIAGTTACLSGVEHVVSHMLDMLAGAKGLPVGLHGAQVGAASLVAAAAWHLLLDRLGDEPVRSLPLPDPAVLEERVRAAFLRVDASGRQGAECWSDYSAKLAALARGSSYAAHALAAWPEVAPTFRAAVPQPETLAAALRAAGAPTGPGNGLEAWIDDEIWRWAVQHCLFMRNRFTVADLLFLLGWWGDTEIDAILARARSATESAA